MKTGRPLKYETPEEMQKDIDAYFESCRFSNKDGGIDYKPTMAGLALTLDMDRRTLLNYSNKEDFFPTVKRAKQLVEENLEMALYGNGVAGVIFNLKNNFGWVDKQEVEQSGTITTVTIVEEFKEDENK